LQRLTLLRGDITAVDADMIVRSGEVRLATTPPGGVELPPR
jgi:O-acetyl-ADP-ribose deacetylase (regulator of RNase III)